MGPRGTFSSPEDSHSLRYCSLGVSAPGSGLPEFTTIVYVDDIQTELYTSDIRRRVPVASWMKEKESPQYWEMATQINKGTEALFRHEVKIVMKRFNHTGGFHFAQVIHGCELRDDGSTVGFQQHRYDGREYMYLDVQTATFVPTMAEAQITVQRWNSPDARRGEMEKDNLENKCIGKLKRFLEHGRADLERRVRPGVKVTHRESGKVTKLHCLVYGFHPRAVDVKWMKNQIDDVPSYETTGVLPNPDGSYQIRVSAEVIPKEGDSYSCYVDHSSLGELLLVRWEPEQDSPRAVIIGAAVIVLVLTSVVVGVFIYRKLKDPYMAAANEEMRDAEERPVT
ncbi:class I histocompatibility antigen, F10 alpha chain-like isoform X2 [Hyla sarda]|uniref:class I histocompatibility antigen, F10 alpha chain-like isoform X2 n=1 Tax=Hyla sarda TaxID=327740 RepID=UPI0024C22740|nr:class I histocompatibility antigen, F10 alpha chain-like isoform X2 [Hyla sarda]